MQNELTEKRQAMRCYLGSILAILAVMMEPCRALDLPPPDLIRENCIKANVIVAGSIVSFEIPHNWPATRTELRVDRVYRGPFHTGDLITYYSSREAGSRKVGDNLLLFLVQWTDAAGVKKWGTAAEFSEFLNSAPLESKITECARRKR